MSEPVRIALIGCGGMGRRHLAAHAEFLASGTPGVELVAICDRDEDRLSEATNWFKESTGREVAQFADLIAALDSGLEIEAVDVSLPTRLHHTVAIEAFDAGLHVFIEKPVALTIRAAQLMIEAAAKAGKVLAVSENFRRVPSNRAFANLIAEGRIGRPYWASSELSIPAEMLHPSGGGDWYRDKFMSGSLVALEMGVHECDLTEYWFGPIERVSAEVRTFERRVAGAGGKTLDVTSEDTCFARIEMESGVVSNVTMTMAGHGEAIGRRFAVGSTGSASSSEWEAWEGGLLVPDDGAQVPFAELTAEYIGDLTDSNRQRLFPDGGYRPENLGLDIADPLRYGVANGILDFVRAIRTDGIPEVGPRESVRALAAAIAMLESSVCGCPVEIERVLNGEINDWQAEIDRDLGLEANDREVGQ